VVRSVFCPIDLLAFVVVLGLLCPAAASAGVIVLSNRANCPVAGQFVLPDAKPESFRLEPGDTLPLRAAGAVQLACDSAAQRRYSLSPDTIYFFSGTSGNLQLAQLGLDGEMPPSAGPATPAATAPQSPATGAEAVAVVRVKVLVDDDEPAVPRIWEQRLRARMAKASQVFERLAGVRFDVAAVGVWDSDDAVNDFNRSLREFETEVTPQPATLAIGFTSQYPADQAAGHLGGTRGPLYPYILIREWSQEITETERLEILVHELGHYLGAVHSADNNSAMRPKMTDRRARSRSFRIIFDPLNTLAIGLVADEIRLRGISRVEQVSAIRRTRLRSIYAMAARLLPDDRTAPAYVSLFDRLAGREPPAEPRPEPLTAGARAVVQAIAEAAGENDVLRRRHAAGTVRDVAPLDGDRLTERLVRRAAEAAKGLAAEIAPQAFLLGLGLGIDDSTLLRANPVVGRLGTSVETEEERSARLSVLGAPTVLGRRDLAQHFVVSAALAILVGPQAAETLGILKEVRDSQGGSGFSFVDLSADLAGVAFATRVREGKVSLEKLATSFVVADFLPPFAGLREGLPWKTFASVYGSPDNDRFVREVDAIRQRITALPGYGRPEDRSKPSDGP
jgi:hypothetical protein